MRLAYELVGAGSWSPGHRGNDGSGVPSGPLWGAQPPGTLVPFSTETCAERCVSVLLLLVFGGPLILGRQIAQSLATFPGLSLVH